MHAVLGESFCMCNEAFGVEIMSASACFLVSTEVVEDGVAIEHLNFLR